MLRFVYLSVLLPPLLSGCVPFPNLHTFAPALSGVVTQDGKPLSEATVTVAAQFSREVRLATTNQDGSFATEAIRELRLTAFLVGDSLFEFTVTISSVGNSYTGFAIVGMGSAPSSLKLSCDIAKPVILASRKVYCNAMSGT
jgi:hypothetical protein